MCLIWGIFCHNAPSSDLSLRVSVYSLPTPAPSVCDDPVAAVHGRDILEGSLLSPVQNGGAIALQSQEPNLGQAQAKLRACTLAQNSAKVRGHRSDIGQAPGIQ